MIHSILPVKLTSEEARPVGSPFRVRVKRRAAVLWPDVSPPPTAAQAFGAVAETFARLAADGRPDARRSWMARFRQVRRRTAHARMDRSASSRTGAVNRLPLFNDYWGWLPAMFEASEDAAPKTPLPWS